MLTEHDLAKYPFLPKAQNYIRQLNLTIKELTETPQIIKHAEQRITQSFETSSQKTQPANPATEIASFPVATMIVAAINDKYLKKRYALHEAKKTYEHLKQEHSQTTLQIAKFFNWNISQTKTEPYPYTLDLTNYLQNAANLQQPEWKLINRNLNHGKVYITYHEATRLLQEEIRKHIEQKIDTKITALPSEIQTTLQRVKNAFTARKGAIKLEEIPQTVDTEAFPPCIKALHNALTSGHHLSHIGRFALTTFLVNIGMPTENILDLYRNLSDFNERLTRYQIEHIAGERGSRTKYRPPKCATLRTHSVCINPDKNCEKARNPLVGYKRKWMQKKR